MAHRVEQPEALSAFLADTDYHWSRPWDRRVFAAVTRIGYAAADLVVTTSRGVADDLVQAFGVSSARVRVIPNPVDVQTIAAAARSGLPGPRPCRR